MKKLFFSSWLCLFCLASGGQNLLENDALLAKIKVGLDYMYNYNFEVADSIFKAASKEMPGHPAFPFLDGVNLYWKHFPLTEKSGAPLEAFLKDMDLVIDGADKILKNDETSLEGAFFHLGARAMLMLYYADNMMPSKVLNHASPSYRQLTKIFDRRDEFKELYFVTGLYNYYVEAYPEKHPVYKPITALFMKGDKEAGLRELEYACHNTIFVRAEAFQFLSLIYLSFEENVEKAIPYSEQLRYLYPNNPFFIGKYIEALLMGKKYDKALVQINQMLNYKNDYYSIMTAFIFKGVVEERGNGDLITAEKNYLTGIKIAERFGVRANPYTAYAYAGLSRIYAEKDPKKAKEYYKIAEDKATYDYILE